MDDDTAHSPTVASGLPGPSGLVAGRYVVRARLGRGASKEVYLAYDERLDREVALAIVVGAGDSAARARVTREAQVTGRLGDHPNVITVYDTGEHEGIPYLVLRAMGGGSLADRIGRERLSCDEAIRIGGEIAAALAHAHAHDVVHRDVKPDNVWLADDGSAALGDFGVAHLVGAERLTADGVVVGTVRYLSPEQIRGGEIGPASDLYALGVTLYELVTGTTPFTASDATGVLTQHLMATPVAPSKHEPAVPAELERLILRLLAKEPTRRPASAGDVVAALEELRPPARARAAPSPDARRVVSVLAARASIGDPEALHELFARCNEVVERHGGTVERYLGDGLLGFFGLSASHDDDMLRAARAAVDLRATTAGLGIGLEAGEVFVSSTRDGATISTGAAITVAGRLAERAEDGEILLGEQIRRALAADADIDGASGRLVDLALELPALLRAPQTPFVGRGTELDELHAALARARRDGACHMLTLAGPAGIGKSRLAGEFLTALGDDVTVLAGRCLAYGEGTTYRAIAELVRGLGGNPRRRIEELLAGDEQAIRAILGATGLAGEPAYDEETAWALRRLLERLARDRPLVVAVEDIHWAEPVLLDLLDHVVALSSSSPILLLCLTRPELLESRPAWAAPQPNRSLLVLDALGEADARELAEGLGAHEPAARIAQRAEGNPLFVEQLVAVDAGDDDGELPASIQAVLAARIDRLEARERILLQRAAVEGRTFHAGALAAMAPGEDSSGVGARLVSLARKGLLSASRAEYAGEDGFRFTHALIREAAYSGLPKHLRGELHAGVADWLEQRPGAADEIVGYHLEQACRLAAELGQVGAPERALAARALTRFEAASRGALGRGDPAAASALLERAVALPAGDDTLRGALLPLLGASLFEAGRMTDAGRVLDAAIAECSDARVRARAQVEREFVRLETHAAGTDAARSVATEALRVFAQAEDDRGSARVWSLRAQTEWTAGRVASADAAWRNAADCARRAGDERELFDVLGWRATAAALGPTPVDEAIGRCQEFREVVAASPIAEAWMINPLATLHAMKGEFDLASRLVDEANATLDKLGSVGASVSHHEALVMLLSGRPEVAEARLREGVRAHDSMGDARSLATTTAMLAQAVYALGRADEAAELCRTTADAAAADDIVTQVIWRGVQAKVLARAGRCEEALALAREAVGLVSPTDLLSHHGDAMLDLADVLQTCSYAAEAEDAVRSAYALYAAKGNAASSARARSLLSA